MGNKQRVISKDKSFDQIIEFQMAAKRLNKEADKEKAKEKKLTSKIITITKVLGLIYDMPTLTDEQKETYNKWLEARNNKDFEQADIYRNELIKENIL